MRAYTAFFKKEFIEGARTYKLMIILLISVLFGILNPAAAKVLPEIMSSMMPEGITVNLGEPQAIDSWTQFYKNMTGMQIIVFVIIFSGMIASELSKGTLLNMLTKGLSRKTVIFAKFSYTSVIWTISYLLCFGITYIYTLILLPNNALPNIVFSAFCLWLFGELLITVMLFAGVLFANILGTLLFTGGFSALLALINIAPKIKKFNPYSLASSNMALLSDKLKASELTGAIIIALIFLILFMIGSILVFNRKKM